MMLFLARILSSVMVLTLIVIINSFWWHDTIVPFKTKEETKMIVEYPKKEIVVKQKEKEGKTKTEDPPKTQTQ